MIFHYPAYFIVPVMPLNEYEYSLRCNMEGYEVYNRYRNMNKDIFEEIDEAYVNESINNIF